MPRTKQADGCIIVEMSIRAFLKLVNKPVPEAGAETDAVRRVVEALDQIEPERARFIAAFGYILSRTAYADLKISREETAVMEQIIEQRGGLPADQAMIVVQMAKARNQLFGGTENFLVTREFDRIASLEEKLAVIDCLYAVAAAEGEISTVEDNEIKQISGELRIDHPDFIAVRSRWRDRLSVLQFTPGKS